MALTDKEEFKQRMRNLDAEEKKIVVKVIPNELLVEELNRRLTDMTSRINQVKDILKVKEVEE